MLPVRILHSRFLFFKICLALLLPGAFTPAAPGQTLRESKLPIVILETNGQNIIDAAKITANMRIVAGPPGQMNKPEDPAGEYAGKIGIEVRGKSSSWYAQKPYGIETRNENGENRNVSIFGWPADNDWILLSNYNDRSLMRNLLSFNLFRAMGHYAPRARLVEVLLNGEYRGIYLFCEKIKRDKGRVNINKLEPEDLAGDALTGGYIFKADYWSNNDFWVSNFSPSDYPGKKIHFVYEYPAPEDLAPAQRSYLQNHINAFENALFGPDFRDPRAGYAPYIDVSSFVDYLIVQEVSRNIDGFKKSSFFHKDRQSKGGLLHAGPVWDFDWAWKNIAECALFAAADGSGFAHQINTCRGDLPAPGWFTRLLADTAFANRLHCRYKTLRNGPLATATLHRWMDSLAQTVDAAQVRHFQRWKILGVNTATPEVAPIPATYFQEIDKLKTWIELRLNWLDKNMPGQCGPAPDPEPEMPPPGAPQVAPNPALGLVELKNYPADVYRFAIFDAQGRAVGVRSRFDGKRLVADVSALPRGIYFLQALRSDGELAGKSLKFVKI